MTGPVENGNLEALLDYLKRSRGFDFTGYKRATLIRRRDEDVARREALSGPRLTHGQLRAPAEDLGQHTPARGGHVLNKDDGGRKVGRQSREDFTQGRESTG